MTEPASRIVNVRLSPSEFFERRSEFDHCELVDGEVVGVGPAKRKHGRIEATLTFFLKDYVRQSGHGEVSCGDVGYQLSEDTVRGADIAVYLDPPEETAGWEMVMPDVVVEVVSPTERWSDVERKISEYLEAGVKEVWLANPRDSSLVRRDDDGRSKTFRSGETFESRILEGFRLDVESVFE